MGSTTRGFEILDAVVAAQGDGGLTFSAIVSKTGQPKASVHRLLKELVAIEVLEFNPVTSRYRGGLRLGRLGGRVMAGYDLRSQCRPHLVALQAEAGHVATLGIRNHGVGVYLDKCEAEDFAIKLHSEIGKDFPLHATAMGKLLLAHAPDEVATEVLSGALTAFTPATITAPDELRAQLRSIRDQGFAVDREEITRGLTCVAAPVRDPSGAVVAAMSSTFQSFSDGETDLDGTIEIVRRHAGNASGSGV